VPLAPFPGVTVASLNVPPGQYLMHVKLRYRGQPLGGGESSAGCAFQGTGIGGLDSSQARVQLIGEPGTADGTMMDFLFKTGDDPEVHVQCFGDPSVHIINTQFAAVLSNIMLQP
jgi:hypothetical protein